MGREWGYRMGGGGATEVLTLQNRRAETVLVILKEDTNVLG